MLDLAAKKQILGLNAARLYGIDVEVQKLLLADERMAVTETKKLLARERAAVAA